MEIDFKKLLEQNADLQNYIKDALYLMTLNVPEAPSIIQTMFNFYNMGMTIEQTVKFFDNNRKMGGK